MKLSACLCILLLTNSCSQINEMFGLKDDNDVEQRIEQVIEQETGLKVDLTPEPSEEKTSTKKPEQSEDSKNVLKKVPKTAQSNPGIMALMAIAAAAAGGIGSAYAGKENRKASEKQSQMSAKEQKRSTLADYLNRIMDRKYAAQKDSRITQSDLAQQRQKSLNEMTAGVRDSYK